MYFRPYAWRRSDISLRCSFCAHEVEVPKADPIPQELETVLSRGWRYLSCPKCQNGFLKIYVKTEKGKWRFKSKTLYAEPIRWKPYEEPGSPTD